MLSSNIHVFLAVGKQVVKVTATDKDASSNGEITYSLAQPVQDNSGKLFDVNPQFGGIKLKASLDREDIDQHVLYVKAQDNGSPKLAGLSQSLLLTFLL